MERFEALNATYPLQPSVNEDSNPSSILRHSLEWTGTFVLIYGLIFVIGLIGNGMLIAVIYKKRRTHTPTYIFIFNLAIADLLVIVLCVPATLLATIFTPWLLGSIMCKMMPYVQGVSVCASAYTLAAISIARCQGVYKPMQKSTGLFNVQAKVCTLLIWSLSLCITFPWLFVFNVIPADETGEGPFCVELWKSQLSGQLYYMIRTLICCYILPLVVIIVANLLIWRKISRRKVPQNAASTKHITKLHQKTKEEVRRMLTLVTFTFLLCWLPLHVILSRITLFTNNPIDDREMQFLHIVIPLAQVLGSFNSCVNPFIYAFVNSKLRAMLKSMLPWGSRFSQSISLRSEKSRQFSTVLFVCFDTGRTISNRNVRSV